VEVIVLLVVVVVAVIATSPLVRRFFKLNLAEFLSDLMLFVSTKQWDLRVRRWKEHLHIYSELKSPGGGGPDRPGYRTIGIDYLSSDRLRILDAKFSTLLQLQTLLGIMVTITTSKFWDEIVGIMHTGWAGTALFVVPAILWVVTIVGCLAAVCNIRWGDLWEPVREGGTPPHEVDLERRAERYLEVLVSVVVARTAVLRFLAALSLVNFLFATCVVSYVMYRSFTRIGPAVAAPMTVVRADP
jgi:hypothetical protein